jgi:hypothetical protein
VWVWVEDGILDVWVKFGTFAVGGERKCRMGNGEESDKYLFNVDDELSCVTR